MIVYRLTEPADVIWCTAGERDRITKMALARGSMFVAFVARETDMDKVHTEVSTLVSEASGKERRWRLWIFDDSYTVVL